MLTRCPTCSAEFICLQPLDEEPCPGCFTWFVASEHPVDERRRRPCRRDLLTEVEKEKLATVRRFVSGAMLSNGLGEFTFGWTWDRRLMGRCVHFADLEDGFIEMSIPYVLALPVEEAIETALHEVGHGLTPLHGHDE